jgi:hypothetical protein
MVPVASHEVRFVSSFDPNEKDGPGDFESFVPAGVPMTYTVFFENLSGAEAPAAEVRMDDVLDDGFDEAAVKLLGFGFRDPNGVERIVSFAGIDSYRFLATVPLFDTTPAMRIHVEASYTPSTQTVDWTLAATDLNGGALQGALDGFLNPGDGGFMIFETVPHLSLSTGSELENDARLIFDSNPPSPTNTVRNLLGGLEGPSVPDFPSPPDDRLLNWDPEVVFSWVSDGAERFDFYVLEVGEERPKTPTASDLDTPFLDFENSLQSGSELNWQVVAKNDVDNVDGPVWQFSTTDLLSGDLLPPENPFPPDNSDNVEPGVTLRWSPVPGALAYTVVLQQQLPAPTTVVIGAGLRNHEFTPPLPLATLGSFLWQVVATDGYRQTASDLWEFSTVENALFKRGDSDVDGTVDAADAVKTLMYLYLAGDADCLDAMDDNDDGEIDLQDPLTTLFFKFGGVGEIPAPKVCGTDPSDDGGALDCEAYPLDRCF